MTQQQEPDTEIRDANTVSLDPPEDAPEPEKEPEPEPDDPKPELQDTPQALDLSALDAALGSGMGGGWASGGFAMKIDALVTSSASGSDSFSLGDLDQRPTAKRKANPRFPPQARRFAPGKVWLLFTVDEKGNVVQPRVQSASHQAFVAPALEAIRKWKFEPGRRKGKPVTFKMKLPMTFPKQKR